MNYPKTIELIEERKKVLASAHSIIKKKNDDLDKYSNILVNSRKMENISKIDFHQVIILLLLLSKKLTEEEAIIICDQLDILNRPITNIRILADTFYDVRDEKSFKKLKEIIKKSGFDYNLLKKIFDISPGLLADIFAFSTRLQEFIIKQDILGKFLDIENFRSKDKKLIKKYAHSEDDYELKLSFSDLDCYKCDVQNKYIKTLQSLKRRMRNYENFINICSKKEGINKNTFLELYKLLSDDTIIECFLMESQEVMRVDNERLNQEYLDVTNDDNNVLINLFSKYGYDYNNLSDDAVLLNLSEESYIKIFEFFKTYNVKDLNLLEYFIFNVDVNNIDLIDVLLKKNILSKEFVFSNLSLFNKEYDNVNNIINLLNDNQISQKIIALDNSILFTDYLIIKSNIEILKKYNLLKNIATSASINYLKDAALEYKINLVLDLGIDDILENNVDILSYSINKIKRLYFIKNTIGLDYNVDSIYTILNTDDFVVTSDNIDTYLEDLTSLFIPGDVLEILSNESENTNITFDSRVFSVDDIYVSSYRYLNNLEKIKDLDLSKEEKDFYAIIYGALYNFDEIEKLQKIYNIGSNVK